MLISIVFDVQLNRKTFVVNDILVASTIFSQFGRNMRSSKKHVIHRETYN